MANCLSKPGMKGTRLHAHWSVAAKRALAAVVFAVTGLSAHAAGGVLSKQDQACLGCHSAAGFETQLANGEKLSLHIDGPAFAKSVHNTIGCSVCHADVTLENHPPLKTKIPGIRENSLELAKVCRSCHGNESKLYQGSVHAALLRQGNQGAPVCTDCHNPHAVMAKSAYDAATGAPCSKCHSPIFKAYARSVHGQAGLACSNCHRAHDMSAAATGDYLKSACFGCHQDVLAAHQKWLPNAGLHFDAVSCAACHAPNAKRKVDLKLYDSATQQHVVQREGVPQFETRARSAGAAGAGLDAMALRSLLHEFSSEGAEDKMTLRGRLEVSTGVEAHQLAHSSEAIRDCAKCHRQGADAFQSVTVSIVGPDGRLVHYGARPEVLHSMISVDSVGGFYAIGGTRIRLLDWLLALALLGGIGAPLGHMTVRWLFKRYAKKISGKDDS